MKTITIAKETGPLGYVVVECDCGAWWEEYAGQGTGEPDISDYDANECPNCGN